MIPTKIADICSKNEFRPALQQVRFENRYLYAIDGVKLVKILINDPQEKACYVSPEGLRYANTRNAASATLIDGELQINTKSGNVVIFEEPKVDDPFPDVETVLSRSFKGEPTKRVGVNVKALKQILDAISPHSDIAILTFYGESDAIKVTSPVYGEEERVAILMAIRA